MSDNAANIEWDNFTERSVERNLGLKVNDTIFWVSRRKLADCSSVFATMLFGEFKESKDEIVTLSEKEPDEILELLRCIFPCDFNREKKLTVCWDRVFPWNQNGERKSIDEENVEMLVRLGDEYDITNLLDRCCEFIKMKIRESSINKTVEFLDLASQYKMKRIVRVGLRRLSVFKTEQLLAEQAFTSLPVNNRYAVLIIQSLRDSRPTDHDFEEITNVEAYYAHNNWGEGYRCTDCGHEVCGCADCRENDDEKCLVCPDCKCSYIYGETEFICECIDPLIEVEMANLGL